MTRWAAVTSTTTFAALTTLAAFTFTLTIAEVIDETDLGHGLTLRVGDAISKKSAMLRSVRLALQCER